MAGRLSRAFAALLVFVVAGTAACVTPSRGPASGPASGTRVVELETPGVEGFVPTGINDRGQIVGVGPGESPSRVADYLLDRGRLVEVSPVRQPPGGSAYGHANPKLNQRGDVADTSVLRRPGFQAPETVPFLWADGSQVDLGLDDVIVWDLNDRRQLLLARVEGEGPQLPPSMVWSNGQTIELRPPAGVDRAFTYSINDRGFAAGSVGGGIPGEQVGQPAIWRVGGAVSVLPALDGGATEAGWVTAGGVVGWQIRAVNTTDGRSNSFRVVVWRHGRPTDIGTLGGESAVVLDVNDLGHVAGASQVESGAWHAFYWRAGRMIDLGPLGDGTEVEDLRPQPFPAVLQPRVPLMTINDRGQVAVNIESQIDDPEFGLRRNAFVWQAGRRIELSETVEGDDAYVADINNRGQIVGMRGRGGDVAVMWSVGPGRGSD